MQRLSAVTTLVIALLVMVVASAQPSEPAERAARAPSQPREFDRHPRVSQADRQLLARAGGWLWYTDAGCHASAIQLATLRVRHVQGEYCRIWPNPQGTLALAPVGGTSDLVAERRLAVIDLKDPRGIRQVATVYHRAGVLNPPVVWSADGEHAAFCITSPAATAVIRVTAFEWEKREIRNACNPAWVGGDRLAFVRRDKVVLGGGTVPIESILQDALRHAKAKITALAANWSRPKLLAVGVARRAQYGRAVPPAVLVVSDLRGLGSINYRSADSGAIREAGIAPDGRGAWFTNGATGRSELSPGPALPASPRQIPIEAWRYAWNDGGGYIAVAQDHRVEVFDWRSGESAVLDNISARDLAWVR